MQDKSSKGVNFELTSRLFKLAFHTLGGKRLPTYHPEKPGASILA